MPLTAKQMIPAIGATVMVRFDSVKVRCVVHDVKTAYGQVRVQVEPIHGEGTPWVEMSKVSKAEPIPEQCCSHCEELQSLCGVGI